MNIREKGWLVLDDGTPLHKIAHRENLPCCTLCAMWSLDVFQDVYESSVSRYAATDIAPSLAPGRWHVIQRWRRLDLGDTGMEDDQVKNGSYGHTYLAYAEEEGNGVTIIQSSIAKGYRINKGTWEGNAGLRGFSVGVLTLPV